MKVRTSQSGVFVAQWEHIKNSQKGAELPRITRLSTKNEKVALAVGANGVSGRSGLAAY
ncbi:hypothetical protein VQ056_28975 [Paenibacillus sp. JTLBN-2024]